MSKFTPGPWRVVAKRTGFRTNDGLNLRDCAVDTGKSAWRTEARGGYTEQHLADARLIASAPDLYEALKQASSLMKAADTSQMDPSDGALFAAIAWQIKAALAKADGGAQ